jgi:hypothetical protein
MVDQTLRTWGDAERRKIMLALRKIQHINELRGTNGPNFRPGLYPLFSEEWNENLLYSFDETDFSPDQPLLAVIPTLRVGAAWQRDVRRVVLEQRWSFAPFPKSLLEYHYRLDQNLAGISGAEPSNIPTCVQELWCVVVNKSEHPR